MIYVYVFVPLAGYLIVAMFTFGRVAAHVAWHRIAKHPDLYMLDGPDWSAGVGLGFLNAVVWPITLPIWVAVWYANSRRASPDSVLFAPPPHMRSAAREHAAKQREQYIRELERKAGM